MFEVTNLDKLGFQIACDKIIGVQREKNGIGTLSEKTLHAVLKNYFEPHEDNHEIPVGGFVADIVNENGIIEIQTRQFNKLLRKLEAFLEFCNVTVVYPMPVIKYVRWLDLETGELSERRKSPKTAKIYDIFDELYKIKFTLDNPRFRLCICMLEAEDIRYLNGRSKDRKRGSSRCDRIPIRLIDEIYISSPEDFKIFIPESLPQQFTSLDYAKHCKISRNLAQTGLNVLTYLEVVERAGKSGNTIIYRKCL
ncbi:MAG: hypothetical protein ACI4I6_02355 [Hominimerdicola sp.]